MSELPNERANLHAAEQVEADFLAATYEKVRGVIPEIEWQIHAPYIAAIQRWKAKRGAVILAHNYQTPEIYHGVADLTGDSLALARQAARTTADVIVMCGVHFMAETAKLLSPQKTVLIPDLEAGCSLATSITADDVRQLKQAHPGVPVVAYVNTSVAVKAESDVCCTSANALQVVEALGAERVILLPDGYLASWVASQTEVEIIGWQGRCEVHERFSAREIEEYRDLHPGIRVIAHPECPPDVLAVADYVGSTTQMTDYLVATKPAQAVLITECSMSDNLAAEFPEIDFVRPCNLCPHMKRISLDKILTALREVRFQVEIPVDVLTRARRSVERMLSLSG
jgi:quinolinate synthase